MSLIPISLELNFLRFPTKWKADTALKNYESEFLDHLETECATVLIPKVDAGKRAISIDSTEARYLFTRFLELPQDEAAVLSFLADVGIWDADYHILGDYLGGSTGFSPAAQPTTIQEFWREQERWKQMTALSKKAPNSERCQRLMNSVGKDLPARLEWTGKRPRVVIEAKTGKELISCIWWMIARGPLKLLTCQNESCPDKTFLSEEYRMYCDAVCASAASTRAYRRKFLDRGLTSRGTKRKRRKNKELREGRHLAKADGARNKRS